MEQKINFLEEKWILWKNLSWKLSVKMLKNWKLKCRKQEITLTPKLMTYGENNLSENNDINNEDEIDDQNLDIELL